MGPLGEIFTCFFGTLKTKSKLDYEDICKSGQKNKQSKLKTVNNVTQFACKRHYTGSSTWWNIIYTAVYAIFIVDHNKYSLLDWESKQQYSQLDEVIILTTKLYKSKYLAIKDNKQTE